MPQGRFVRRDKAALAVIHKVINARLDAAAIHLVNVIKESLSHPGTAVAGRGGYQRHEFRTTRDGRVIRVLVNYRKGQRIYGYTRSKPGDPPYKQTGHLRRSIAWERDGDVRRVGTNLLYGKFLELGTRKMKARPFLRPSVTRATPAIRRIIDSGLIPASQSVTTLEPVVVAGD